MADCYWTSPDLPPPRLEIKPPGPGRSEVVAALLLAVGLPLAVLAGCLIHYGVAR